MIQIGKTYKTVGGWDAVVIYIKHTKDFFWAIHAPGTESESVPTLHQFNGMAMSQFSLGEPPRFNQTLPADIIVTQ